MVSRAEDEILIDKKIRFEFEVQKSAEELRVPIPRVVFYKTRTHFNNGERAHIHLSTNTICISEAELKIMDYDEIRNTASHEVSHLKHSDHSTPFWTTQTETESSLWRPPSGVSHIVDLEQNVKKVKSKKEKEKKIRMTKKRSNNPYACDFCGKRISGMPHICKYCHKKHCYEHVVPEDHLCENLKGEIQWKEPLVIKINSKKINRSKKLDELPIVSDKKYINHKTKKDYPLLKITFFILGIILLFVILRGVIMKDNTPVSQTNEEFQVDKLSDSAFLYLNYYRNKNDVENITFDKDLYLALVSLVDEIEKNPNNYASSSKMLEYINSFLHKKYRSFYVKSYFIKGGDYEYFKKEFDLGITARNLIKLDKYSSGAVGCNIDYCVVALYEI